MYIRSSAHKHIFTGAIAKEHLIVWLFRTARIASLTRVSTARGHLPCRGSMPCLPQLTFVMSPKSSKLYCSISWWVQKTKYVRAQMKTEWLHTCPTARNTLVYLHVSKLCLHMTGGMKRNTAEIRSMYMHISTSFNSCATVFLKRLRVKTLHGYAWCAPRRTHCVVGMLCKNHITFVRVRLHVHYLGPVHTVIPECLQEIIPPRPCHCMYVYPYRCKYAYYVCV